MTEIRSFGRSFTLDVPALSYLFQELDHTLGIALGHSSAAHSSSQTSNILLMPLMASDNVLRLESYAHPACDRLTQLRGLARQPGKA